MTVYTWSQTAADNDDIDSTINWQEGQSAGSLNNSARAMMAALAKWRDDTSGKLVATGSSNAYAVTTNQTFTALSDGLFLVIEANHTNTGAASLNVDSLGAKSLIPYDGAEFPAGEIIDGAKYAVCYDASAESGVGAWIALNYIAAAEEIASGTVMLFAQTAAPTGWTKSTTHNDKSLRVVSGTASSGGSTAFSTVFASKTPAGTVGNTTLTVSQIPAHTHFLYANEATGGSDAAVGASDRAAYSKNSGSSSDYEIKESALSATLGLSSSAGSGSAHTHTFTGTAMDFAVQYVDVILAAKD